MEKENEIEIKWKKKRKIHALKKNNIEMKSGFLTLATTLLEWGCFR